MPGIKGGLVLINMAALTLQMLPFFFKDDKIIGAYRYCWKPVMKAGKEETTCLLGVPWKCSVKASIHVLVKGKKGESPAPEPAIKDGNGKKNCLLDGEKRSVHAKAIGDSWESEGSQQCIIWPWPCWTRHGGSEKNPGEWNHQEEASTPNVIMTLLKTS